MPNERLTETLSFSSAAAGFGRPPRRRRFARRGFSILWLFVTIPIGIILLIGVAEFGNVWLARVELENSLEAAALAAVKEWGDANGGSTLVPREIGVEFAHANAVRCKGLDLDLNYDPNAAEDNPNENLTCCVGKTDPETGVPPSGILIFGALIKDDPVYPKIFNAGIRPSCGLGQVLFDVSANRNLEADNSWGIAFLRNENTPDNLLIKRVIIDLRASGGIGYFISDPVLSSNAPGQWLVRDRVAGNSQPDIEGFTNLDVNGATGQVRFFLDNEYTLRIEFSADGANDAGFEPCDRIRFGINTEDVAAGSQGKYRDDGDGIGFDQVGITVIFEQGGVELPPVSTVYINTMETGWLATARTDPFCGDLIVAYDDLVSDEDDPVLLPPNLPHSPSSAHGNNGQSWVLLGGAGQRDFLVSAKAIIPVKSLFGEFCGCDFGTRYVSAQVIAVYDCETRRPRLIRIDHFICPGPDDPCRPAPTP